ncbi:MAG: hypothetical protein V7L29_33120 [Nostoc sp.]|uniref:hypothetical protein n=1 Tax=Nostoc sp. TaxID=1180 RepID=UPI002FF64D3B
MDIDRLAKNTQFSKTDQLSEPNISEKNITFEYQISAKPSWQWWVIYRGVMPDWNNLNKNIKKDENWKYFSPDNPDQKGTVSFDYDFKPGAIYTLALFKDETENAYDLADYVEFWVDQKDNTLSNLKISEDKKTITFDFQISAEPSWQWWVIYRGVMPDWNNLNKNIKKDENWQWVDSNKTGKKGPVVDFKYEFTPGAIYTLALFKDETENAYDLADYYTFRVPPEDDKLSNLKTSENTITFDYQISAEPNWQWWVIYRGVMPDWNNLNKNIKKDENWKYFSPDNPDQKGTVSFDYDFKLGAIYTLALFKDETENAYDLADYIEFSVPTPVPTPWTVVEGENSYCYCACNSTADNKQKHDSSHTMNIEPEAPYFYAVLTKDDDTVDFPYGAVLKIEGPDGTKYDRDIQEENQLVIMSDSSVRCLIVKDPKPGDWKMTMTVPEGVGFHCECNTVPSKDPYKTITNALSQTNQLQKRDSSNNDSLGWKAGAATGLLIGASFGSYIPAVGTLAGGFFGAIVGAIGGKLYEWVSERSDEPVSDVAGDMESLAESNSTAATGEILLLDANADHDTKVTYEARKSILYKEVEISKYAKKYTSLVGEENVRSNVQNKLKNPSIIYCTASGHGLITALKGWGPNIIQSAILEIDKYEPAEAKNKIFHFQACCCGYPGGKPDSTNICITPETDPALSGLGADLVKNGAKAFFGYRKPYMGSPDIRWRNAIAKCDVEIDLKLILGKTAEEAYEAAITMYKRTLKKFLKSENAIPDSVLGALKHNMENLVAPSTNSIFGDKNAKL